MAATRITTQDILNATIAAEDLNATGYPPSDGDILAFDSGETGELIWVSPGGTTFVDSETPSGTINGSNDTFTLAGTPATGSLHLYKNGIRQRAGSGNDYQLSTATITFEAGNLPQTGDVLLADYRT